MQIVNGENQACSDRTTDEYLTVNSCGFYEIGDREIVTVRPCGRMDYQLIYVASGRARYLSDDGERLAEAGDILLWRPHERQEYAFLPGENTSVCWVHFTGFGAGELLREAGLFGKRCFSVGVSREISDKILELIREIQLARSGYQLYCRAILTSVVATISRMLGTGDGQKVRQKYARLIPIIEKMNTDMHDTSTIEDYAKECFVDPYYFITLFREYTGRSPHTYRTMIKLEKAKQLLSGTNITVGEVASLLGYGDSMYFSRIFKKYTGLSPCAYKKQAVNGGLL